MTDRLVIEIIGALPEAGEYAILASAEDAAKAFAGSLTEKTGVKLTVSVRAVRPGKKTAPIVQAKTLTPEPVVEIGEAPLEAEQPHPRHRVAAE